MCRLGRDRADQACGSGVHFHPSADEISLLVELVDLHLEVEGTEVDAMIPSVSSGIANGPVVQVEVEPKVEFEPCNNYSDYGSVTGQALVRGLVPDGLDPERPCISENGQGLGVEIEADFPRPPVHTRCAHPVQNQDPATQNYPCLGLCRWRLPRNGENSPAPLPSVQLSVFHTGAQPTQVRGL